MCLLAQGTGLCALTGYFRSSRSGGHRQHRAAAHRYLTANRNGALVYQARVPNDSFAAATISRSRLAFCAWVRTGWAKGNPDFNSKKLYEYIPQRTLSDVARLFGNLATMLGAALALLAITVLLSPGGEKQPFIYFQF